ncbi:WD repeat-containing protein 88-like [Lingula anatina]|uniref:WD repeat-containing protein 88-like n=1 Tax=Lingula anatina TaxID=7574 RepID=A0A1S3IHJ5_LINAN|nr:WD repeat-containing protein 88-like [Lingula anatina]|eukprot:XP_013396959.1 WD repeat-containing protein 88-like [Lingula anatina]
MALVEKALMRIVKQRVLRGHEDAVQSCQYCCDDQKILTASFDKMVKLWGVEQGEVAHSFEAHTHHVNQARMSPDNKKMVSGGWDKKMHVWDVETGRVLWTADHPGIVTSVSFSKDGKSIVSSSDLEYNIRVWDAEEGRMISEIKGAHASAVTSCNFTPRDDRLTTTSMDMTSKFWDLKSQKCTLTLRGHINIISDCSITADERRFATASWDKTIALWDIATGSYRSQGATYLKKSHEGSISSVAFSPDGSMLVSGGYDMNMVVWDADNCAQKLKLQGHESWIEDLCWSQDQNWIMSCSKDHTVRLWNVEDSDELPVVMENKRTIGVKIITCTECGKPFSMMQAEDAKSKKCVFCRMQKRDYFVPTTEDQELSSGDEAPEG